MSHSPAFEIKPGDKFACIAFNNIATDDSLDKPLDLGNGFWVLPSAPIALDAQWQKWVGTIKSERIGYSNLFLIAVKPSNVPQILDDENEQLQHKVYLLFYGLLLQGLPDHIDGWIFKGAQLDEGIQIRSLGDLRDYYHSNPEHKIRITAATCQKAKLFLDGYERIENDTEYQRLKRGMRAVIRGIEQKWFEDRIHEYVRALEAITKPEIGASLKQFADRCQTFAVSSDEARKILEECYAVRSAAEHMHSFDIALTDHPEEQRKAIGLKRLHQIEVLAFAVYFKLGTSAIHAAFFETDIEIDSFWKKKHHDRYLSWEERIDITAIK